MLTSEGTQPALLEGRSDSTKRSSPHSSSGAEVTSSRPGSDSNLFGTSALSFSTATDNAVSAKEREASPSHRGEPSSSLTLYNYLVDLIGESLTLSLSATTHEGEQDPSAKPSPSKPEPPKANSAIRANYSLEDFLSKEGFRPIRVQLPRRPAPPPSIPRGYYKGREPWTFNIPYPLLPTRDNVLEQKKLNPPPARDTLKVLRGKCSGHHRYYRRKCHVNIASYWV